MVEGEFEDMPTEFRKDVDTVYNVLGLIPAIWGDPVSPHRRILCLA